MEELEFYVSSDGFLVIPEYDIKYLIDFMESNIPSMPEASETSVKIAGRDGDVPLKTTYEPIPFNIVCYTEDNLTPEEKRSAEAKINRFVNSMKKSTKQLGFEQDEKFYDVKYSGSLTTVRYPKHLKFSIPLKSSDSYAKFFRKRIVTGNKTFDSDTVKETGAVFTINGPATNPIISFNGYEMSYENSITENSKLIIDTGNSTTTFENALGTKTNAMRYYNHNFPKIQSGSNELEIQSGIENESQVSLEWYDLVL